jgi:hypothetical protein
MTAYCPTINSSSFWLVGIQMETGSSIEAKQVQRNVEESLEHYLRPRLEQLFLPIIDLLASSQSEETPVTPRTVNAALAFARLLPRMAPIPDVSSDPDGEISFDWIAPSGKMFSVSVNRAGRLSYAGWFGEDSRVHGTEKLDYGVPAEILRGIQKANR